MKFLTMLAIVLGLGLSSAAMDAEAKRFGGAKSEAKRFRDNT